MLHNTIHTHLSSSSKFNSCRSISDSSPLSIPPRSLSMSFTFSICAKTSSAVNLCLFSLEAIVSTQWRNSLGWADRKNVNADRKMPTNRWGSVMKIDQSRSVSWLGYWHHIEHLFIFSIVTHSSYDVIKTIKSNVSH